MGAINPTDKLVEIYINGHQVNGLFMRLGNAGSAYFVDDVESLFLDSDSDSPSNDVFTDSAEPIVRVRSADDVNGKIMNSFRHRRRLKKARKDVSLSESQSNTDVARSYDPSQCSPAYLSDSEMNGSCRELASCCNDSDSRSPDSNVRNNQSDLTPTSATLAYSPAPELSDQRGVYLEDLVTPSVDESVKQAYLYVRKSSESLNQAQNVLDAGYKSDPENASRLKRDSSENMELKISLCGGLSADAQIDYERFCAHLVTFEEFCKDPAGIISDPNLVLLFNDKFYNWNTVAPMILSKVCFRTELSYSSVRQLEESFMPKKQPRRRAWFGWGTSDPEPQCVVVSQIDKAQSDASREIRNETLQSTTVSLPEGTQHRQRRITLTSREVESLGLKPGANNIEFRIVTKYQGTASCCAKIFLWRSDDKVVVSDVDGTITRSDILGHLLPMLGRDWTHEGVAELFSRAADNGYKFVYLSARAIGQSNLTRSYLDQVCQRDKYRLPDGPILLSPTSLLDAFHREIIAGTPELFKIECLKEVRALFGPNSNPFYAAFGNRTNDVKAYTESGFESSRIYTVYPKGELRNEFLPCTSNSFEEMINLVDHFFPFIPSRSAELDIVESDEEVLTPIHNTIVPDVDMSIFSSFAFWREPISAEIPI